MWSTKEVGTGPRPASWGFSLLKWTLFWADSGVPSGQVVLAPPGKEPYYDILQHLEILAINQHDQHNRDNYSNYDIHLHTVSLENRRRSPVLGGREEAL